MVAEENGSKVVEQKLRSLIYRLGRVDGMRSSREKGGLIALWLRDSAPKVLEVVSEQPPDFEVLIPPRLENHYLDFLKEELLLS